MKVSKLRKQFDVELGRVINQFIKYSELSYENEFKFWKKNRIFSWRA